MPSKRRPSLDSQAHVEKKSKKQRVSTPTVRAMSEGLMGGPKRSRPSLDSQSYVPEPSPPPQTKGSKKKSKRQPQNEDQDALPPPQMKEDKKKSQKQRNNEEQDVPESSQPPQIEEDKIKSKKQRRKEEKAKLPPLTKNQWVPAPTLDGFAPSSLLTSDRTLNRKMKETIRTIKHRIQGFIAVADNFKVNLTLEDLAGTPTKNPDLDRICEEELGPQAPSRTLSAKYYTKDGEPLFFYFGDRYKGMEKPGEDIYLDIEDQYENSTPDDLEAWLSQGGEVHNDGIDQAALKRYHLATQKLCSVIHPVCAESDKRHEYLDEDDTDGEFRVLRYVNEATSDVVEERKGVLHIVQGWIQQGQPPKGLYLSSWFIKSSSGLASIPCWFKATEMVSITLKLMFEALFPEVYQEFKQAFEAGQWVNEDPGPWLGKAIVYKLQVQGHVDQRDMSPTASFPCGNYTGGEMLIPQLPAKFSYKPGHVCIFHSAQMYHRVARWEAGVYSASDEVTPGRIGSVSFFPEESFKVLKKKPAGWGRNTAYGEWDSFMRNP